MKKAENLKRSEKEIKNFYAPNLGSVNPHACKWIETAGTEMYYSRGAKTLSIKTLYIATTSIMGLITTLSIMGLITTLSIMLCLLSHFIVTYVPNLT